LLKLFVFLLLLQANIIENVQTIVVVGGKQRKRGENKIINSGNEEEVKKNEIC